jgi:hypothetical protein
MCCCSYNKGRTSGAFLKFIEEAIKADSGASRVDTLSPIARKFMAVDEGETAALMEQAKAAVEAVTGVWVELVGKRQECDALSWPAAPRNARGGWSVHPCDNSFCCPQCNISTLRMHSLPRRQQGQCRAVCQVHGEGIGQGQGIHCRGGSALGGTHGQGHEPRQGVRVHVGGRGGYGTTQMKNIESLIACDDGSASPSSLIHLQMDELSAKVGVLTDFTEPLEEVTPAPAADNDAEKEEEEEEEEAYGEEEEEDDADFEEAGEGEEVEAVGEWDGEEEDEEDGDDEGSCGGYDVSWGCYHSSAVHWGQ